MATPEAAKELGNAAFRNGDMKGAIEWFTKAIDLDLDSSNPSGKAHTFYSNRAAAYSKLDQHAEALGDAEKCVALKPDWGKGYSRQGLALIRLGRYKEARDAYKTGMQKDPQNLELQNGFNEANRLSSAGSVNLGQFQQYANANPSQALQLALRGLIVLHAILYLIPFFGRGFSFTRYRHLLFLAMANYILALYKTHGMVKFNMQYLAMVMRDPTSHYIFLCGLLLIARPNIIAICPILIIELVQFGSVLSEILPSASPTLAASIQGSLDSVMPRAIPQWGVLSRVQRVTLVQTKGVELSAMFEVGYGVLLVLEMVTPMRNILATVMYWQFLQMRYMLEEGGAQNVRNAFSIVDTKISSFVGHPYCPSIIGKAYGWIRGWMANMTKLPAPGERPKPKCTIM
uniref:Hsp70-Hsp90 organising protein n=1 Tax=Fibrocapsa japonica TaxID=94617 RepID=A0A7S2Y0T9_9STRA|mmetsp:Transcript_9303/g.14274  ORF Transcript_9303/g.14274 Transcript_9303/m.14274 type:complete len:401 (+) Transcript_9303:67-1269(+)|eukprot:CAMPEP_0113939936 /NCGR_PEP_ID=MMETSP1339-20121228/6148_1 /TAXON_ID=94617 /ORGANISM="Fibrocapsa japonica" /LENGTH=400 /DNA_ID=CAMNT_0000943583 /DNA_START=60 /DNA_END=1262 /DNA_ORIENTATION=- /assembly_acc=CAM_ASM_000762